MNIDNFPIRIRTEAQIAQIYLYYSIAMQIIEALNPTAESMNESIAKWEAMGTDDALAMASAYRDVLATR
jgi:hypothetical protein